MPVLFICFILFILWFRVKSKKSGKEEAFEQEDFWRREQEANFARKRDISGLDYLTVDKSRLPFGTADDEEGKAIENDVEKIISKKIINLSGMTNTDLKLAYGRSNLDALTEYDQNYTDLVRTLNKWGVCLYKKNDARRARDVFEYAISIGSDITETYSSLAKIYLECDEPQKVRRLIECAEESGSFMKDSIISNLRSIIQEY